MRGFVLFVIVSVASSGCLWFEGEPEAPAATGEPWPDQTLEPASDPAPTPPTPEAAPTPTPSPPPADEAPADEDAAEDAASSPQADAASAESAAANASAAANDTAATNATGAATNDTGSTSAAPPPGPTVQRYQKNMTVTVTQAPAASLPFGGPRVTGTVGCIQVLPNGTKGATTVLMGGTITATWEAGPGGPEEVEFSFYPRGNATATRVSGVSPMSIAINATVFAGNASAPRLVVGLPSRVTSAAIEQDVDLAVVLDVVDVYTPRIDTCNG